MQALLRKIRQILKDRRTRKFLTRVISSVAAIVVFVTTYALILPAITLEKTAVCGIEAHQHDDSCYEERLVCGQEENDGHHHDDSCYSTTTELTCGIQEHQHSEENGCYDADGNLVCRLQEHVHDDSCYEEVRTLTCGLEESEGHHHTDACYEKVLACGKEVHIHSDKCYEEGGSTDSAEDSDFAGMPSDSADAGDNENTGETGETGNTGDTGDAANTVSESSDSNPSVGEEQSDSYVSELELLDMEAVLNRHTDFYYFHAEEGEEVPANSAEITEWKKVDEETILASTDLVKMYLAYKIPAGSLNATNPTARYRLPDNIHLSDEQIKAINLYENGIAAGYREISASAEKDQKDKAEENYKKYLGVEAVEGDRRPDEQLMDGAQEFISAVVRAENIYDEEGLYGEKGAYLGQDLIFTFAPYSVEKNQNTYDADKTLISAGEKITGWFACDFELNQIDWEQEEHINEDSTDDDIIQESVSEGDSNREESIDKENIEQDDNKNNDGKTDNMDNAEKTAKVIFVREDQEKEIEEISRVLRMDGEIVDGTSSETMTDANEETGEDQNDQNDQVFEAGTLTFEGDDYSITLDYGEDARIPENASLSVREITAETDKEAYEACLEQAGQQVAADDKTSVDQKASRFFDIEIIVTETDSDGVEKTEKLEPSAPVSVNIQINDKPASQESGSVQSEPTVLHFAEEGVEQIDSTVTDSQSNNAEEQKTEILFEAESFSVYGVVYTVDFHYEVNGKMYEFSIPGGGFASFYKIVEVLSISNPGTQSGSGDENEAENREIKVGNGENNDGNAVYNVVEEAGVEDTDTYRNALGLNNVEVSEATREFVADVANVEFSSPELVWVGKVDEETTVGGLKEANGLEVQYSAELTEEQIAEINNSTVEAGDWALISVLPFTSEESLTVTMKNGDQFVVRVTDAQKPYKDPAEIVDGYYLIYTVTNGTNVFLRTNGGKSTTASNDNNYKWYVHNNGNGTFTIRNPSGQYINLYGTANSQNSISQIANSTSPVNVTLTKNGSNGIRLSYNGKYLGCNGYGNNQGFYPSSSGSNLIFYGLDESSGSSGVDGIVLTDAERAELEEWENTLEKFNTLTNYGKTAEKNDYDNRIYKIDISASSGITDFYKDVDLGFVLDVSNSMNFPSSLAPLKRANGTDVSINMDPARFDQLLNSSDFKAKYDIQNCFYIISDPALTSTIYKIYKVGNDWKYMDASGGDEYDLTTDTVFKEVYKRPYTIYYADDTKTRFTYLKDSVNYSISVLNKIVTPTEVVDDGTASVRIAYNLFAGSNNTGRTTIRQSDTFTDLRERGNTLYSLTWSATNSGTKQNEALYDGSLSLYGHSANEFGWDISNSTDKYVILVTDGAPNGPSMNDVRTAAQNLKNAVPGLKIISIGLSTQDVDGGSQMLYDIADDIGGVRQFYEAEKAKDLEYILLKILRTIMAEGLVRGKITDTIDSAFYPVDASGNPVSAGVYNANGKINGAQISDYVSGGKPTTAHANESFYTWEQVGDKWKITWYNQEIGWDDNDSSTGNPWTGTAYVKAKEDYLGGNLISTNDGNAQIEPTGIKLVINGQPEANWRPLEGMTPISLPVPRINVHNLESAGNSTTWTVYKDTTVTPAEQIRALWNNIPIEEVVSETDGGNNKVTTGAAANVGTSGSGETFKLADLLTEFNCKTTSGATFNIDTLINSLDSGAGASVSSDPIIYNAYGHESGTIMVTLKREVGTAAVSQHNADTVGTPVEKYGLTVTYQPYSESTRTGKIVTNQESGYTDSTNHHNGSNGRGAEETGTIISTNTHTINVFQKGIKVTKVDRTNPTTVLPGAVFELYRVDAAGTDDVSSYSLPSGTYSKVGGDLTADANGIITIDPAIPDKDTDLTDKTLYEPNVSVGATTDTAHETVFYLVEKTPPTKNGVTYSKMPGAIKFTMTLSENKGTDTSATLYDWAQIAVIAAEECGNGSVEYLTETTTGTNSDIYAYMLKNGRPTDITLIKIDKVTKNSISGAKFSLLRGSENVDLTDSALTISAINDGATVTPEDYDFNGTTIKVVTVPEGGIKIAGLVDGTYTLREVTAPAGYIITDSGKTFKTENGAIKNTDDTAHTNEATDIAFEVENEPGAALPNTGGPGTKLLYLIGCILTMLAGTGLVMKRRRRKNVA